MSDDKAASPVPSACPTCHGSGLVWRWSGSKPRLRDPDRGDQSSVALKCPDCPDDGTGNSVGTGCGWCYIATRNLRAAMGDARASATCTRHAAGAVEAPHPASTPAAGPTTGGNR